MKRLTLILILIFISVFANSQDLFQKWTKSFMSTYSEESRCIYLDKDNNLFTAGNFRGICDFDPGPDSTIFVSNGYISPFITKFDTAGNFIFAKHFSSTYTSSAEAIATDTAGNIYVCGSFGGTCDFDPDSSTYNLSSFGPSDIFITKLNSTGAFIWAKSVGGSSADETTDIYVDVNGNSFITGRFRATADFDPDTASYNLTSNGLYDIFILKLDAQGAFCWVKSIGGSSDDCGNGIDVDVFGNSYVTGYFTGTADFDTGNGLLEFTSNSDDDAFLLKLDAQGNFVYAKQFNCLYDDVHGMDIALDPLNNIYITGELDGTVDFDPGPGSATTYGSRDIYIVKLSPHGDYLWTTVTEVQGFPYPQAIDVDYNGSIYTTGYFLGKLDFNTPGVYDIESNGSYDGYVLVHDSTGQFQWAGGFGGLYSDKLASIVSDPYGITYTAGSFQFDGAVISKLGVCEATNTYVTVTSCDQYELPNGQIVQSSGLWLRTLSDVNGCDSIIHTDLTIIHSTDSVFFVSECAEYLSPAGNVYTESGLYYEIIPNSIGCDSIIRTYLTIQNSSIELTESSCESYLFNGLELTASGYYVDTLISSTSCDSVIHLNLEIINLDTSISQNVNVLSAGEPDAIYQWIDCSDNTPILGATQQSYEPLLSGSYAVILTKDGCSALSSCITFTYLNNAVTRLEQQIRLYPNPIDDEFTIDLGVQLSKVSIVVFDMNGKQIFEQSIPDVRHTINCSELSAGSYSASIKSDETIIKTIVFIKE